MSSIAKVFIYKALCQNPIMNFDLLEVVGKKHILHFYSGDNMLVPWSVTT